MAIQYRVKQNKACSYTSLSKNGEFDLREIALNLRVGSEIFEVNKEENKEILLGQVSKKMLIYIGCELFNKSLKKNISNKEGTDYRLAKKVISFCRKWPENSNSNMFSDREISNIKHSIMLFGKFNRIMSASYRLICMTTESPDYYYKELLYDISFMSPKNNQTNSFDYSNYMAYSKFIIKFLKSDKHLFMV